MSGRDLRWILLFTTLGSWCCGGESGDASDALLVDASVAELDGELDTTGATRVDCHGEGTPGATAGCLLPTKTPEYYVAQGLKYFDTLDVSADPLSIPDYAPLVARWEWPPWLKLTGYERQNMLDTAAFLREYDPSTVPVRDCRFFEQQPFCRCYITFEYEGRPCPIYEEFTFNDQGQMTFIEAWSDLPGLLPLAPDDPWGEAPDVPRLSTRVPGLGNAEGLIELGSQWMREAEARDPDVADLALRARDPWLHWTEELKAAGDDLYERGCGW
jgi:hypothetical protein